MEIQNKKCDATGKTTFKDYHDSLKAIYDIKTNSSYKPLLKRKRNKKDGNIQRSYYCRYCSGYHLTSQDRKFKKNNIINDKVKSFFNNFDISNWKKNSIPFPENYTI
jgi:hypothetical protein